jgi:hypothetical protein
MVPYVIGNVELHFLSLQALLSIFFFMFEHICNENSLL